jgi:hypothetical protein
VAYRSTNFANCSSHDQSPKYQVHGSVFTANSHKSRLSHFSETAIVKNWQFAVKRSPIVTALENGIFTLKISAQIRVMDLDSDQDRSGSFLLDQDL